MVPVAQDAKGGGGLIEHGVAGGDAGDERVELRGFETPERGTGNFDLLGDGVFLAGGESGLGLEGREEFAIGRDERNGEGRSGNQRGKASFILDDLTICHDVSDGCSQPENHAR